MTITDNKCSACQEDAKALHDWREKGGKMPKRTCAADHRPVCKTKGCGTRHANRKSGLCDTCWATRTNPVPS